ncbi:uncharacterized protein [Choristoneura fumiferana]|uniref:uncharacterized protein n=1 Tax=Choristoneura fumiferana TaxID=7141 RepID=UPI003D15E8EE
MGLVKFCKEVRCNYSQETQNILSKYNSVFEGRGSFSGEIDLEIDKSVPPVVQKARRIPVALWPVLKEELKKLEAEGIITKEDNHTDWRRSFGSGSIPAEPTSCLCLTVPYSN